MLSKLSRARSPIARACTCEDRWGKEFATRRTGFLGYTRASPTTAPFIATVGSRRPSGPPQQ